jgi:hypothetical protein
MIGLDIAFDVIQYLIKFFRLNGRTVKIVDVIDDDRRRDNMKMVLLNIIFWQVTG